VPLVNKVRKDSTLVMMVFLELKEHKVFKVRKERFKDIREPVVMEVQQVTSVQQGQHKVHRDLRVHKVLKELKVHKVWFKGILELKVLKEEQEIQVLLVTLL
jgi:hypothetical protein